MAAPSDAVPDTFDAEARLSVFGFEPNVARVRLRPRSRRWRVLGAVGTQVAGIVAAPLVGLVPPHAPWALGAVGVGYLLARRRWAHRFTVEAVEGACPRCGNPMTLRPGALKDPHRVPCEACHHDVALTLDASALRGRADPSE